MELVLEVPGLVLELVLEVVLEVVLEALGLVLEVLTDS